MSPLIKMICSSVLSWITWLKDDYVLYYSFKIIAHCSLSRFLFNWYLFNIDSVPALQSHLISGLLQDPRKVLLWGGWMCRFKEMDGGFSLFIVCVLSRFSHVWLFATLWTVARQAPPSMGFSRQEFWSGLPFPPPGVLPDPGIESASLCLLHWRVGSLPLALWL